jgi:hypothetical protein
MGVAIKDKWAKPLHATQKPTRYLCVDVTSHYRQGQMNKGDLGYLQNWQRVEP